MERKEEEASPKAIPTRKEEVNRLFTPRSQPLPISQSVQFTFAEDMLAYEEKKDQEGMERTSALVIHVVPCHWHVKAVGKSLERKLEEVNGARWLLNKKRREQKTTSSIVVYLDMEVRVRRDGRMPIMIGGKKCWMVYLTFSSTSKPRSWRPPLY